MIKMKCALCNKESNSLTTIDKQLHGEFKRLSVCDDCKKQHERDLEMTRQNFYRQFGQN